MTGLTSAGDRASLATPAPPQPSARNQKHAVAGVLADPRMRLAAGTAVLLVTAMAAHRDRVSPWEATAFRAVNGLPDSLYPPAWAVMQLGTLGAAPATAGAAWLSGDRSGNSHPRPPPQGETMLPFRWLNSRSAVPRS